MFNIKYKGKYENEDQLKKGYLPENAVMFKEPNNMTKVFIKGFLISSPIIILTLVGLLIKIDLKDIQFSNLMFTLILTSVLTCIHEIIHALCFSKESEKEIWTKLNEGALFVYCSEIVSKKRFIWIGAAPNVLLGFIPYILFIIGVFNFSSNLSIIIGVTSWVMILCGIGDYLNIYNTMKQVPKDSNVVNYGFHSYWFK